MTGTYFYKTCGLTVESDLRLTMLRETDDRDTAVRVAVTPDLPPPDSDPLFANRFYSIYRDGACYLSPGGYGRYRISGGNAIQFTAEETAFPLAAFIVSTTCLSILFQQRGWFVFKGCAVGKTNQAMALLGEPHWPFSGIIRRLRAEGWQCLGDGLVVMDSGGGLFSTGIRSLFTAHQAAKWCQKEPERLRPGMDVYLDPVEDPVPGKPLALTKIHALIDHNALVYVSSLLMKRLRFLHNNIYWPNQRQAPGEKKEIFIAINRTATETPMEFHRFTSFSTPPKTIVKAVLQ